MLHMPNGDETLHVKVLCIGIFDFKITHLEASEPKGVNYTLKRNWS